MAIWIFEPGHTEAEFRARHMMVTWVRGLLKDIHGRLELDWERCLNATFEGVIDATGVWTGEPNRDAHLRSADFVDVENHPKITFTGTFTERSGADAFKGDVELTIRGTTRTVPLDIAYLGEWKTPFWVGDENRASFAGSGLRPRRRSTGTTSEWRGRTRSRAVGWSSRTRSNWCWTWRRSCSTICSRPVRSSTTETRPRQRKQRHDNRQG